MYAADTDEPQAVVWYDGAQETTTVAYRGQTNTFTKQVQESVHDGTKSVSVKVTCGDSASETATFIVDGSLVDVEEVTTMREFNITMDSRSNGETDKTIKDGGVEITVENCNWSSNGDARPSDWAFVGPTTSNTITSFSPFFSQQPGT